MVGFSPLASSALGDEGIVNYELTAANIVSQAPSVANANLTEDNSLTATSFSTGASEVNQTDLTQDHSLTATTFTSGTPEVNQSTVSQDHSLTATALEPSASEVNQATLTQAHGLTPSDILTGNSVVSDLAMSEAETFSTTALETDPPSVPSITLVQDHDLGTVSFESGNPVLATLAITQIHSLTPDGFTAGTPLVANTTLTEIVPLTADNLLSGTPSLDNTSLTQVHDLTPNSIVTPVPDVDAATDPNAILAQETQEIEQMIGGWTRRAYEVPDGRLVQGEREIQQTYGDKVSIDRKAKSLVKFGRSAQLGTGSLETVWSVGGNETYLSTNSISHVSSSSASDTQEVTIEGHTLSNNEFTFVTQTATLNGQNTVALSTDLARVSRIYNSDSTELVGRVVVYENTALSGGVPTDATKIHIDIPAGFQQSFKAATTFSKNDYFIITSFYGAVSAKQSGSVDFYPEIKQVGKVFRQAGCFTASTNGGSTEIPLDPPLIVPKNADIRIRCETLTNNLVVFGIFKGYIAKVL
jgi:hypothetical protein